MIIEFSGLPKSGKSTAIGTVRDYFLRNGYTVQIFAEGARMCPFSNKNRIEIASWTANRVLNNVLETKLAANNLTLVVQDRGLFDSLAFFNLLYLDDLITTNELNHFLDYFAFDKWTRLIDIVIILGNTPKTALERDLAAKLSKMPGLITNLPTLDKLTLAYDTIINTYGSRFPRIEYIDTQKIGPYETAKQSIELIQSLLP